MTMMAGRLEQRRSPFVVTLLILVLLCVLLNTTTAQGNTRTSPTTQPQVLKVKVVLEEPFIMRSKVDPVGYEGMLIDLLDNITERSHLAYTIDPEPETLYGHELSPGNWTGLVGSLINMEADLIVAPLTIRSVRQKYVDFTLPIMTAGLRILFKPANPWTDTDSFTILWRPFTAGMWAALLLMFVSVSVLFYLLGRFSPYEDHALAGTATTCEGLTLRNSFLYAFSSFTFQGYTAAPRSLSGRVLATFWWVFALMVLAAYSASLCAIFLAFKPAMTSLPFTTFDQLSQQSHVAYGIYEAGVTEHYLKNSRRPLQRRLWETINAHREAVMVKTFGEGVRRMRATPGQYALIMEGPLAEYLSEQAPCDLVTVGEELNRHHWGFACQKGSRVCSALSTAIMQIKEEGVIFDLKKKWLHNGCQRDNTAEYIYQGLSYIDTFGGRPKYYADRSVTLRRFSMGFVALVVGMSLSVCLLLGEVLYAKRRRGSLRVSRLGDDQERMDREYMDADL